MRTFGAKQRIDLSAFGSSDDLSFGVNPEGSSSRFPT
jgi:hypothetical protein